MKDNQKRYALEQEITKQLDQMDEKFDRSGWFYLLTFIAIIFISLAIIMYFSNSEPNNAATLEEMTQKISQLEERINQLEAKFPE